MKTSSKPLASLASGWRKTSLNTAPAPQSATRTVNLQRHSAERFRLPDKSFRDSKQDKRAEISRNTELHQAKSYQAELYQAELYQAGSYLNPAAPSFFIFYMLSVARLSGNFLEILHVLAGNHVVVFI